MWTSHKFMSELKFCEFHKWVELNFLRVLLTSVLRALVKVTQVEIIGKF